MKKCMSCGSKFQPYRSTEVVCSVSCAAEYGRTERAKKERKKARKRETTELRREHRQRSVGWWHNEKNTGSTAYWFHRYVRARDARDPCISCGKTDPLATYVASHYRSRGAAGHLRYHEDNCHKACSECNTHLSGNIGPYRIALVTKIGEARVLEVEHNNEIKKFTVEDCRELRDKFKRMALEAEEELAA